VLRGLLHGLDAAPSEEATSEEETDDAETVA
jgi:hypothetical protein